jgi:hypothetical protein
MGEVLEEWLKKNSKRTTDSTDHTDKTRREAAVSLTAALPGPVFVFAIRVIRVIRGSFSFLLGG